MMPVFFASELEGVATYWRIFRRDGVTLGFSNHNRALWFDGIEHRAAPGMVPSAIRLTTEIASDSAEVSGALSHDSIREADLDAGIYDGARIEIGAASWEALESMALYSGSIGKIERGRQGFKLELQSAKSMLERSLVPRTSPTCRAEFCGEGCSLSPQHFTHRAAVHSVDLESNTVSAASIPAADFMDGTLRFLAGPQVGLTFSIIRQEGASLSLDRPLAPGIAIGTQLILREGCDHTLTACHSRFGNAVNFRGEPFLPGNDLISRYPTPGQ